MSNKNIIVIKLGSYFPFPLNCFVDGKLIRLCVSHGPFYPIQIALHNEV